MEKLDIALLEKHHLFVKERLSEVQKHLWFNQIELESIKGRFKKLPLNEDNLLNVCYAVSLIKSNIDRAKTADNLHDNTKVMRHDFNALLSLKEELRKNKDLTNNSIASIKIELTDGSSYVISDSYIKSMILPSLLSKIDKIEMPSKSDNGGTLGEYLISNSLLPANYEGNYSNNVKVQFEHDILNLFNLCSELLSPVKSKRALIMFMVELLENFAILKSLDEDDNAMMSQVNYERVKGIIRHKNK